MKKTLLAICITVYALIAFGQVVNDESNFFNYKYDKKQIKNKKVKTAEINYFTLSGNKYSSKKIFHFKKDGTLTKLSIIDSNGVILREYYFKTNSHNDLIAIVQNDFEYKRVDTVNFFKNYLGDKLIKDSASELPIGSNYEYATNGVLIKTIINSNTNGKTKRVIVNKLDNLNRVFNSIETVFQGDKDLIGSVFSNRDFFYDSLGRLQSEIEKITGRHSWIYNKGTIYYAYDQNGNLTKYSRVDGVSNEYTYNDKGLLATIKTALKIEKDEILDTETRIKTIDRYSYTFYK